MKIRISCAVRALRSSAQRASLKGLRPKKRLFTASLYRMMGRMGKKSKVLGGPGTLFQKGSWPPEALIDGEFRIQPSLANIEKNRYHKTMLKQILLILLLSAMLRSVVFPADPPVSSEKEEPAKPKLISITWLIPGIQQMKNKQYVKGGLFLGTFAAAITGTVAFNQKGNDWYSRYSASTNVANIAMYRDQAEKAFKKRNICITGIFTVWLFHILDLKFFSPNKGGIHGSIHKDSFNFGFYYSF